MDGKSNGVTGPHMYLPPGDLPSMIGPDPGPPISPDVNGSVSVPETSVPKSVSYKGGGIFAEQTSGPSFKDEVSRKQSSHTGLMDPNLNLGPIQPQAPPQYMAPSPYAPPSMGPMPGDLMPGDPMGEMPHERAHMLGLTVITVALGTAVGAKYGGVYGGIAGGVLGGTAVNAYRAFSYFREGTKEGDKEAQVSGFYTVATAALGAVIWSKMVSKVEGSSEKKFSGNKSSDDDADYSGYSANPDDCEIRTVGP